jgi:hypothetical protein
MIADNQLSTDAVDKMWNTFFHLFLDKGSSEFLEAQCRKLLHESATRDTWDKSKYSSFLRFRNDHTRLELRRHWQLYADAEKSSPKKKLEIKGAVISGMQKVRTQRKFVSAGFRSAGPYVLESMTPAAEIFSHYWTKGTTFMDDKASSSATNVNPTFVYSLVGTFFSVHHGTTPIAPFHLAPAFQRSRPTPTTASNLIDRAKSQFRDWATSFQAALKRQPGRITIRLFCGEALRFCQALTEYRATGSVAKDQTVAPWNTAPLVLDDPEYIPGIAFVPLIFNVIETSNLSDHVGLLNILIATTPLLSEKHSATLFTQTFLYGGKDPAGSFNQQFCADLSTIGVLFDLLPTCYPSNFSSRSNVAEIIVHKALSSAAGQYQERLMWRRPITGDSFVSTLHTPTLRQVTFEPLSLAKLLLKIYFRMFSNDDPMSMPPGSKTVAELTIIHYIRETFVALVATIKRVVVVDWDTTLDTFFVLLETTKSSFMVMGMGLDYHQELCAQVHLAGIHTVGAMKKDVAKQGRFQGWRHVPPTVSVTLVVPREGIQPLLDMDRDELSTPIMQASLKGRSTSSSYSSIKMGFGRVKNSGTGSDPRITFDADPTGFAGSSPLVVSFSVPSWMLGTEGPENMFIALSLRLTPQTIRLTQKFGMALHVFKAQLTNTSAVFVVPEEPHGMCYQLFNTPVPVGTPGGCSISAVIDPEGERISTLAARADILDGAARVNLSSGSPVTSRQVSPCAIEISIGQEKRWLVYPSPVVGTLSKLRIARKSCYIEVGRSGLAFSQLGPSCTSRQVIAPLAGKYGLSINPFPISVTEGVEAPWNIHRLNLDILPVMDISQPELLRKISVQLAGAVTDREQSLRDAKDRTDTLLGVKNTIHAIVSEFLGSRRARAFMLRASNKDVDTLIFATALRLDLASHGFVIDAQVLAFSDSMGYKVKDILRAIFLDVKYIESYGEEAVAWKRLLPAFAERCRTWKHGPNCEYLAGKKVPLSLEYYRDLLCSCGKGKDVTSEFRKEEAWELAIPYVTRVAIGPLYGVPYAEDVGRFVAGLGAAKPPEPEKWCQKCGGLGKPKLLVCGSCKSVSYCSVDCQKADWKTHKGTCRK